MADKVRYKEDIINMQPIKSFIFDSHCHMGPVNVFHTPFCGSAESMLRKMDIIGIDKIAVSHLLALFGDCFEGNRQSYEAAVRYRGRVYQLVVYDPNLSESLMLEDFCRYIDLPSTAGAKIHPMMHGTLPDDVRYEPVFDLLNEKEKPILIHTWGCGEVAAAKKMAEKFKKAKVILGHMGGVEYRAIDNAVTAARECDNIFLDLTMSLTFDGLIEYLVKRAPVDKILFGSDMPYIDPISEVGRLAFARISENDREKIFGANFLSLINMKL